MTNLLEILPSLQVTADDVLEAELFAQQYLQAMYPDLDLREGTGVRDLVIRPTATLLALVNKGIDYHFSSNAISKITDSTPQTIVDDLMSNWFLSRRIGTKAILNIRLFFSIQKAVFVPASAFFSPDNILMYNPIQNYTIPAEILKYDAFAQEWYVDIDISSEISDEIYNQATGSLLYFTNFDPYFLRAEINYLKESSISPETNSQFLVRAKTAISTRNLINKPSIASRLQEEFSMIRSCVSIGFGDPEMIRDEIYVNPPGDPESSILFHNGGKVDIYCRTGITKTTSKVTTGSDGKVTIEGPIYKVVRATGASGDTMPTDATFTVSYEGYTGLVLDSPEKEVGFSPRQKITLDFGSENGAKTVSLELSHFVNLEGIQNYIEDADNRVVCADLLARGFNLYLLDMTVVSYVSAVVDLEVIKTVIETYLNDLEPGEPFVMSDLISRLSVEGITSIQVPIETTYTLYKRDFTVTTDEITDILDAQDRTSIFLLNTLQFESSVRAPVPV